MPKQPSTPWDEEIERLSALPRPGTEEDMKLVAVVGAREGFRIAQARTAALVEAAEDVLDVEWMGVTETYRPVEILIKSERLERLAEAVAAYRKGETYG